jgi:hypothetical protein
VRESQGFAASRTERPPLSQPCAVDQVGGASRGRCHACRDGVTLTRRMSLTMQVYDTDHGSNATLSTAVKQSAIKYTVMKSKESRTVSHTVMMHGDPRYAARGLRDLEVCWFLTPAVRRCRVRVGIEDEGDRMRGPGIYDITGGSVSCVLGGAQLLFSVRRSVDPSPRFLCRFCVAA